MIRRMLAVAAVTVAASGVAAVAQSDIPRPNTTAMSIKDIRIHNASLTAKHPQYIVCKRQSVTGSLAKKTRTCLTNEVWQQRADSAREFTSRVMDNSMHEDEGPT